jgi:hypothetical protein
MRPTLPNSRCPGARRYVAQLLPMEPSWRAARHTGMSKVRVIVLVGGLVTLSGCLNGHSGRPLGTLSGRELYFGGPPSGGGGKRFSSPFQLVNTSGAAVPVPARRDGTFEVRLPAGTYTVKLPPKLQYDTVEPRKVTVRTYGTTRVVLRVSGI